MERHRLLRKGTDVGASQHWPHITASPTSSRIALDDLSPSLSLSFVFRKIGVIALTLGSRGAVGRTELGSICGEMSRHPGAWETQE